MWNVFTTTPTALSGFLPPSKAMQLELGLIGDSKFPIGGNVPKITPVHVLTCQVRFR